MFDRAPLASGGVIVGQVDSLVAHRDALVCLISMLVQYLVDTSFEAL